MYALLIWTIVGFAGTSGSVHREYDWRPLVTNIPALAHCQAIARELGYDAKNARCVFNGIPR